MLMKGLLVLVAALAAWAQEPRLKLQAVPARAVTIDGGFWSQRLRTNREKTVPHVIQMCETEGRVRNMLRAAGKLSGGFEGMRFHDADLYKVAEAAAYVLAATPDPGLRRRVQDIVAVIASAQRPDGYLHTYAQVRSPGRAEPKDLQPFAAGHLLDAGVAWRDATGDATLLATAARSADLFTRLIGPGRRVEVPSHPKIESALVRLYHATGERRYLELARFLLDERGRAAASGRDSWGLHAQDHLPVREQRAAEGHVICGLFLYAGMFDVALETGDRELLAAVEAIFRDAVGRRMYITGAMGRSDERFTEPYALDNRTSIGEGCQSAALIRLAQRLFLLTGEARYADVIERVLYNNLAANVSLDGQSFFYHNRLCARPEEATGKPYRYPMPKVERPELPRFCLERQPWFTVPCCPPNVAMAIATLGDYVYARGGNSLYVAQYVEGAAKIALEGSEIEVMQQTRYPWDGRVTITVTPSVPRRFQVYLRIPDWLRGLESTDGLYTRLGKAGKPRIRVNSRAIAAPVRNGFTAIDRTWTRGDRIEIDLPMRAERIRSHPGVTVNSGRVAVVRGPVVYCLEAADHGGRTRDLTIAADAPLVEEFRPGLLGGVSVIKTKGWRGNQPADLLAVPYGVWANRGAGDMDVWVPVTVTRQDAAPARH